MFNQIYMGQTHAKISKATRICMRKRYQTNNGHFDNYFQISVDRFILTEKRGIESVRQCSVIERQKRFSNEHKSIRSHTKNSGPVWNTACHLLEDNILTCKIQSS